MIRFILVSFLFLGWAFYELSGGAEFEPEERVVADASGTVDDIDIVTRGADPTLASLAVPARLTQPLIAAPTEVSAEAPVVDDAVVEAVIEDVAFEAPAADEPVTDLREVAGSRVNMRTGPGTDYNVVTTLDGGTRAEVIDTDPSGWVKLRVVESGLEGWMAARLLTTVNG